VTLDDIAELWRQPELSLSAIGDRLGLSRGQVVGKIDRARKACDPRFQPRPAATQ
jgi:DNA-binding MarR family transcriptional regulator